MARGKYAHKKTGRDAQSLTDEIAALTTELAAARERLKHVQGEAVARAELEATLRTCVGERDAAIAPERQRVTDEIAVLTNVLSEVRDAAHTVDTAWQSFMDAFMDQHTGNKQSGLEAIESMMSIIIGRGAVLDPSGGASRRKLGTDAAIRIDKARGERGVHYTRPKDNTIFDMAPLAPRAERAAFAAWVEHRRQDPDSDVAAPETVKELTAQWRTATAATLTPTAALAGHPHPAVDTAINPEHPLARVLGLSPADAPSPSPRAVAPPINQLLTDRAYYALRDPWVGAEAQLPLWRAGRDAIRGTNRIPSPLHPSPRHPSPADAVALRHWYSLSAAGSWARTDGTDDAAGYGEAAIALTAASNFWMPPGQVRGYLDSDPISAEDRAHIRLAYPNIFLALGKPIVLDPTTDPTSVDVEDLEKATLNLLYGRDPTNPRHWLLNAITAANQLNVLDLIAARGARIEGVLLLADDHGTPSGTVAWCLAVPGRAGMLGRWVLPAHRDRTIYADQIDAMIAVAAWADWHQPADPDTPTSSHRRSAALQRAAATGGVHVLSAARAPTASTRTGPPTRTVAAHIRRGHWRRQPVGVGRTQIRMVRVSPAIIGAGNLARSAPVYRLPSQHDT